MGQNAIVAAASQFNTLLLLMEPTTTQPQSGSIASAKQSLRCFPVAGYVPSCHAWSPCIVRDVCAAAQ